jgi:hypothetical protein
MSLKVDMVRDHHRDLRKETIGIGMRRLSRDGVREGIVPVEKMGMGGMFVGSLHRTEFWGTG